MVSDHLVTVINLNCIHTLITLINTIHVCDNLMSTVLLHKENRVDKEDGEHKEEKEDREDKEGKEGTEDKED